MMPIINPRIFYLIDILSNLKGVSRFATFITVLALIIIVIITAYFKVQDSCHGSEDNIEVIEILTRFFKKLLIVACIAISVFIVTPSEETMYKMLVAQNVTYENVDKAQEEIKETVDYIFKKLGKEDKKDE